VIFIPGWRYATDVVLMILPATILIRAVVSPISDMAEWLALGCKLLLILW
jgi:hypothetical protein